MQKSKIFLAALACSVLFFSNCKKEKEAPQESITSVTVIFTQGTTSQSFIWKNESGGTTPEQVDTIRLNALAAYTGQLDFSSPETGITSEIKAESLDHLCYYTVTGGNLTMTSTDVDTNGSALGLEFAATTDQPSTGTVRIVLKHLPDKTAADPSATGETDVDVVFPLVIE